MTIVIDSSVTLGWLFEDESNAAAEAALDRLGDEDAVVPPVWQLEVTTALLVAEAHPRVSGAQVVRLLTLLGELPITTDHSSMGSTAVHAAARRHELSAYQASYLVLAERRGLALASTDESLISAANASGVVIHK